MIFYRIILQKMEMEMEMELSERFISILSKIILTENGNTRSIFHFAFPFSDPESSPESGPESDPGTEPGSGNTNTFGLPAAPEGGTFRFSFRVISGSRKMHFAFPFSVN